MRPMLANLQRAVVLLLVVFVAGWAAAAVASGHSAAALGGAAIVFGGYLAIMALEFVLAASVHGDDPAPRPTVAQRVRAWWNECTTSPRVFCWEQPFRADAVPDHLPAGATGRGLVLVHGFVCNRGFWNRWMPQLVARDIPFVAVNLEPVFGPIGGYAPIIEAAVQRVTVATGHAPVVVAHSMGGLAVRAWLAQGGGDAHHVITIGSPHRGTWTARFSRSHNAREMRGGSDLLAFIEAHETPAVRARFTNFYSHCDNIVFPPSTAVIPGAENRHVTGMAHVELADHPAVFDEALRRVAQERVS
jgi:triacylglycerol lipase